MPVKINDLKTKGFFKIRIEIAEAFDSEDETEKELAEQWGDAYVDLRELNATEAAEFQENPKAFMEKLEHVVVGHNFYQDEEGKKLASNAQVADEIRRSSTVYNHVMSEWVQHLPLVKRSATNSAKLPKT